MSTPGSAADRWRRGAPRWAPLAARRIHGRQIPASCVLCRDSGGTWGRRYAVAGAVSCRAPRSGAQSRSRRLLRVLQLVRQPAADREVAQVVVPHGRGRIDARLGQRSGEGYRLGPCCGERPPEGIDALGFMGTVGVVAVIEEGLAEGDAQTPLTPALDPHPMRRLDAGMRSGCCSGPIEGSRVSASTWRGRRVPKWRRSSVASYGSPRRSVIARTAASTKPISASA